MIDLKDFEEVMLEFYLNNEINKRDSALVLLSRLEFKAIPTHYKIVEHETKDLPQGTANEQAKFILDFTATLPPNTTEPSLNFRSNDDKDNEVEGYLEWRSISVAHRDRCASLAKCWLKSAVWAIKHQSKGKEAIKVINFYNELIAK